MKDEEKVKREINPEKFQMAWCPSCRGTGKLTDAGKGVGVCTRCGGFGWVKKEHSLPKGGEENESNHH